MSPAGREDHKVFLDGEQLSWPWGEDQPGLDQALRGAKWLQQWLGRTTGEKLEMVPVLTLPDLLAGDGAALLNAKQVELCGRQLDLRCRDVATLIRRPIPPGPGCRCGRSAPGSWF